MASAQRDREQQEAAGRHAELAAVAEELHTLGERVTVLSTRHAALAAAVSEDLAIRMTALQQLVTSELDRLRGQAEAQQLVTDEVDRLRGVVDVLLTERKEREKNRISPVDWTALTAEQAAVQWPILARWVGEVLVPRYELTRDELPDCWALHGPVVAELSWLRAGYVHAYLTRSAPQLAADWHTRWRPAVLSRIRELIKSEECSPGKHAPKRGTALETATRSGGALPRTQLASPSCWWPFYERAYHQDLAARAARATAEPLDWSPARASA